MSMCPWTFLPGTFLDYESGSTSPNISVSRGPFRKQRALHLRNENQVLFQCFSTEFIFQKNIPSNAYRTQLTYVTHCRYPGMVSKLTKKPENRMVGIVETGPKNTPASTLRPAPISSPRLWATSDVRMQINTNIAIRFASIGCDVRQYTTMTYTLENNI